MKKYWVIGTLFNSTVVGLSLTFLKLKISQPLYWVVLIVMAGSLAALLTKTINKYEKKLKEKEKENEDSSRIR